MKNILLKSLFVTVYSVVLVLLLVLILPVLMCWLAVSVWRMFDREIRPTLSVIVLMPFYAVGMVLGWWRD